MKTIMKTRILYAVLFLSIGIFISNIFQSKAEQEYLQPRGMTQPGRFQIYRPTYEGNGSDPSILLDTVTGKSFVLIIVKGKNSSNWVWSKIDMYEGSN
jgi:hypothetical protein